jgi:RNA polymerase sigma factor (sigma-70 family)
MAAAPLGTVLRHVRNLAVAQNTRELSDAQLLARFAAGREEAAFAALVQRHGWLVWDVCRRVLRHDHDAEDAFQATFLVLARNAATIRKAEALPSWLHGAAHRIALRARRDAAIRRARERRGHTMPAEKSLPEGVLREALALLDEEVRRLPPRQRAAFVLCALEGKSQAEAARQLACKEGTVSAAVTRARQRLARQLTRRGVTLSAALAAVALGRQAATAMPAALTNTTIQAALLYAAGKSAAAAGLCAGAAALAEGATRTMFLTKAKAATAVLLVTSLVTGAGLLTRQALAARQAAAAETPARNPQPPSDQRGVAAAQAEAQEPTMAVSGRVFGPDGKPFEGARVFVWTNAFKSKGDVPPGETTGMDGRFRLAVAKADLDRDVKLVATAEGHGPDWADAAQVAGGGELMLRLVKDDVPINGRIRDLEGQPVAGATIHVLRVEQGDLKRFVEDKNRYPFPEMKTLAAAARRGPTSITTDKDGRFRLAGFGRDRAVLLQLRGPNIENNTFHVLTRTEPLPGMRNGNHGTYLAMFDHLAHPGKPIVGTVREKGSGRPLAGITVFSAQYEHVTAQTDAQGHYRIEGAGKHKTYWVSAEGCAYFNATKMEVPDTPGVEPLVVDFELERGLLVRGRVTDRVTGKPVRGHVGWLALADNPHVKDFSSLGGPHVHAEDSGKTAADGSFRVLAIPGPGLLNVLADDANRYPGTRTEGLKTASGIILQTYHALVRVDPCEKDPQSLTCDIVLEPGRSLAGTVTDPGGRPLAGVHATGLAPVPILFAGARTLETPSFTVGGLRPGEPRALFFLHADKKLGKLQKLPGDEKGPLTVRLEPLGTLTGRILDARGRPWAGLKVVATYDISGLESARVAAKDYYDLPWELLYEYPAWSKVINREVTTDSAGRFRIDGLAPGLTYYFAAKAGDGQGGAAVVTREGLAVESGKRKDLGDLRSKELPGE